MIINETARSALCETWGFQACQNPANWPDSFDRLMAPSDGTRTSYKLRFQRCR